MRIRLKQPVVLLTLTLLLGIGRPGSLPAQDAAPTAEDYRALLKKIEALEQKVKALESARPAGEPAAAPAPDSRVQDLEGKVKSLEAAREQDKLAAEARAKTAPRITLGEKGFSFSSADTNFAVQLRGLLQVDSRTFFNDTGTAGNDGILLRRARPIFSGTVFRDFDFLFAPDFGGSTTVIQDAYLNYRYSPELQLKAGKFKTPVGLEFLQSDQYTFFTERSQPTALAPARDLGFDLHGDLFGGLASYDVGVFNSVGDGRTSGNSDFEDDKGVAARLFFQPFKTGQVAALKGLGFGLGASYDHFQGTNTAGLPNNNGYSTPVGQQFFAYRSGVVAGGEHWRLSPQGYYFYGPFGLLGEYIVSEQKVSLGAASARLDHTAWQIAAGWVLTGEDAAFTGVVPKHAFDPLAGHWGAWQVVARYSELNPDAASFPIFADPGISATTAQEWAVGLQWYLNRNVRVSGIYSHIWFGGAGGGGATAPGSVTRKDENVFLTRVQLSF